MLHEYYLTVTAGLKPGLPQEEAREDTLSLGAWSPLPLTTPLMEEAWDVQDRWGFSYWDSMIVAAARAQGCRVLLTEDLTHDQDLEGLRVVSPFLEASPL